MPKQTFHFGTRRDFIKSTALAAGVAAFSAPSFIRAQGLNEKINIACIGVGGKGNGDSTHAFTAGGNIVAICDVDANTLNKKHSQFKDRGTKEDRTYDAKLFKDWRK